jgi:diguanylate cyclase (GGDEF)-like protein/putative nucleotidyltransferase with HDIG domain
VTQLPWPARVYVVAVIALGALVVATTLPYVQFPRPGLFATLLVLSVMSSALKVDMPIGVGSSCISLSYVVDFTALLLLGPEPTILIAMASALSQCTFRMKERNPPHRTIFSMACLVLTVIVAGSTYRWLGGTPGHLASTPLQPLLAAVLTYFIVNSLVVAAAFALATRRPVFRVWHDNFLWSVTSYVVGGLTAGLAVELSQRTGHWQTPLAFVPLFLTYRTYKIYLSRISDEQRRVAEWTQLHRESTEVLARAIQAKDGAGPSHVDRVQYYAATLARALRLSELDTQAVETAALLHDIGKLAVPEHILSKPGPLTADERRKMQIHAHVGAEIVDAVSFPSPVAPLIRSHHEKWDGTGYPSGLRGEQIPVGARILAVVDSFDAMTSERPYRRAASKDTALQMLRAEAGKAFDPAIVEQFTALLPFLNPPSDVEQVRRVLLPKGAGAAEQATPTARRTADAFAEIASANQENYTLYEIARAMGRSLSLSETMTLISSRVSDLVPFSACALFTRGGGGMLRCRYASGLNADLLGKTTIKEGFGLSGWVARHGQPLVNGIAKAEFRAAGVESETALESALVCPLIVNAQVIGTLAVFHVEAGCYREDHRRVLEEICHQAADVVNNALVFEQTQDEALKDGLTGLANARGLHVHLARELDRAHRTGEQFSVVLLDFDDFKGINDEYGHLAGDRALQEVARVLRETTRSYDVCIRYGGDEFVVLLASCGQTEAEHRRRSLQEAVASIKCEAPDGRRMSLGVSAGIGVFPDDGDTYERLLVRADRRMYQDKAKRKVAPRGGLLEMPRRADGVRQLRSVGSSDRSV